MKKELIITFALGCIGIFWIAFVLIQKQSPSSGSQTPTLPTTTTTNTQSFSQSDIQKHNTSSDCWIIIRSNIYSVSSYLQQHPGGAETIIPYCGMDATDAYNAIKEGRGHSNAADQDLTSLLIGSVQ